MVPAKELFRPCVVVFTDIPGLSSLPPCTPLMSYYASIRPVARSRQKGRNGALLAGTFESAITISIPIANSRKIQWRYLAFMVLSCLSWQHKASAKAIMAGGPTAATVSMPYGASRKDRTV